MKHTHDIEKKLETALNSLDGIERAHPQPYFYTRLRAKLARNEKSWGGIAGLIARPIFALAIVCIVLFVNTWILFDNDTEVVQKNSTQAANDLPEEYNLAVNTFYNYDTP